MAGSAFAANTVVDDGVNKAGVRTIFHWEGDEFITQRQQDMEPVLAYVKARREQLEGQPWGEGKEVGYIPELYYEQIARIEDRKARGMAVKQFFQDHPQFCYYSAYLK